MPCACVSLREPQGKQRFKVEVFDEDMQHLKAVLDLSDVRLHSLQGECWFTLQELMASPGHKLTKELSKPMGNEKVKVKVPLGAVVGDLAEFTLPDGRKAEFKVPMGAVVGKDTTLLVPKKDSSAGTVTLRGEQVESWRQPVIKHRASCLPKALQLCGGSKAKPAIQTQGGLLGKRVAIGKPKASANAPGEEDPAKKEGEGENRDSEGLLRQLMASPKEPVELEEDPSGLLGTVVSHWDHGAGVHHYSVILDDGSQHNVDGDRLFLKGTLSTCKPAPEVEHHFLMHLFHDSHHRKRGWVNHCPLNLTSQRAVLVGLQDKWPDQEGCEGRIMARHNMANIYRVSLDDGRIVCVRRRNLKTSTLDPEQQQGNDSKTPGRSSRTNFSSNLPQWKRNKEGVDSKRLANSSPASALRLASADETHSQTSSSRERAHSASFRQNPSGNVMPGSVSGDVSMDADGDNLNAEEDDARAKALQEKVKAQRKAQRDKEKEAAAAVTVVDEEAPDKSKVLGKKRDKSKSKERKTKEPARASKTKESSEGQGQNRGTSMDDVSVAYEPPPPLEEAQMPEKPMSASLKPPRERSKKLMAELAAFHTAFELTKKQLMADYAKAVEKAERGATKAKAAAEDVARHSKAEADIETRRVAEARYAEMTADWEVTKTKLEGELAAKVAAIEQERSKQVQAITAQGESEDARCAQLVRKAGEALAMAAADPESAAAAQAAVADAKAERLACAEKASEAILAAHQAANTAILTCERESTDAFLAEEIKWADLEAEKKREETEATAARLRALEDVKFTSIKVADEAAQATIDAAQAIARDGEGAAKAQQLEQSKGAEQAYLAEEQAKEQAAAAEAGMDSKESKSLCATHSDEIKKLFLLYVGLEADAAQEMAARLYQDEMNDAMRSGNNGRTEARTLQSSKLKIANQRFAAHAAIAAGLDKEHSQCRTRSRLAKDAAEEKYWEAKQGARMRSLEANTRAGEAAATTTEDKAHLRKELASKKKAVEADADKALSEAKATAVERRKREEDTAAEDEANSLSPVAEKEAERYSQIEAEKEARLEEVGAALRAQVAHLRLDALNRAATASCKAVDDALAAERARMEALKTCTCATADASELEAAATEAESKHATDMAAAEAAAAARKEEEAARAAQEDKERVEAEAKARAARAAQIEEARAAKAEMIEKDRQDRLAGKKTREPRRPVLEVPLRAMPKSVEKELKAQAAIFEAAKKKAEKALEQARAQAEKQQAADIEATEAHAAARRKETGDAGDAAAAKSRKAEEDEMKARLEERAASAAAAHKADKAKAEEVNKDADEKLKAKLSELSAKEKELLEKASQQMKDEAKTLQDQKKGKDVFDARMAELKAEAEATKQELKKERVKVATAAAEEMKKELMHLAAEAAAVEAASSLRYKADDTKAANKVEKEKLAAAEGLAATYRGIADERSDGLAAAVRNKKKATAAALQVSLETIGVAKKEQVAANTATKLAHLLVEHAAEASGASDDAAAQEYEQKAIAELYSLELAAVNELSSFDAAASLQIQRQEEADVEADVAVATTNVNTIADRKVAIAKGRFASAAQAALEKAEELGNIRARTQEATKAAKERELGAGRHAELAAHNMVLSAEGYGVSADEKKAIQKRAAAEKEKLSAAQAARLQKIQESAEAKAEKENLAAAAAEAKQLDEAAERESARYRQIEAERMASLEGVEAEGASLSAAATIATFKRDAAANETSIKRRMDAEVSTIEARGAYEQGLATSEADRFVISSRTAAEVEDCEEEAAEMRAHVRAAAKKKLKAEEAKMESAAEAKASLAAAAAEQRSRDIATAETEKKRLIEERKKNRKFQQAGLRALTPEEEALLEMSDSDSDGEMAFAEELDLEIEEPVFVAAEMSLGVEVDTKDPAAKAAFQKKFAEDLAKQLGCDPSQICVDDIG